MIVFKNLNLSRLLSPLVAAVSLGRETGGGHAFSRFFLAKGDLFLKYDRRLFVDQIEQFNHVRVAHSNTTVAVRPADLVLVFRAMNVDEAIARVRVVFLQPIEPENTRHHQVLRRRKRITRPERHATSKNCSARQPVANLFSHPKTAERRFQAAMLDADSEPRSRNRIGSQQLASAL